jgi:hypothetical protein
LKEASKRYEGGQESTLSKQGSFPSGSEERESNPPTLFEQRYASYENFDPLLPFAPYASTSHMGFDSQLGGDFGQHGHTFDAPPPEQPRPSMADDFYC